VCQFFLEHQGQKVTANGTFPGQTITDTQHHLAAKSQNLAVSRSTNNGGDILVFSDEIARNNDIESWLVATFRYFLARAINFASFQGLACSLINSRDCRPSFLRFRRKISRSRSSSARLSSRDTNSCAACRMTSDLLLNGAFAAVFKRSIRFNVVSSIVIAIVFISGVYIRIAMLSTEICGGVSLTAEGKLNSDHSNMPLTAETLAGHLEPT
jgi:hypothetical protein